MKISEVEKEFYSMGLDVEEKIKFLKNLKFKNAHSLNELSPINKYVLCLTNRGTWRDSDDPINCYFKVLKRIRRPKNDLGWCKVKQISGPKDETLDEMKDTWESFGVDSFESHEIVAWWPLPEIA